MFFTYLHGKYVLFLEDDRPFKRIEKNIIYSNFVEEAILMLKKNKIVKGITFKNDNQPWRNYYYVNGPSVYNIKYLLNIKSFISESNMAAMFRKLQWYNGFTYKGIKFKFKDNLQQNVNLKDILNSHLGIGYSTQHRKRCRNYMY